MPRSVPLPLAAAVLAVLASGCGSGDAAKVEAVTERFYAAVRQDDGGEACELLTAQARKQLESQTGQDCEDVVARLDYDGGAIERAEVYITNAKVDLSSGESAFLSLEADGWRLSAVACRPETGKPRDRPFDCEVDA